MFCDLSKDHSLWHDLDLSYGWIKSTEATLKWLVTHRLSSCHGLNLTNWKNLTGEGLTCVAEGCPVLSKINLSHCTKITIQSLNTLAERCPLLSSVDLSFTTVSISVVRVDVLHLASKHTLVICKCLDM